MKLIERHKAAFGLDRFLVMADRAYNNSRVETFHIPVRKAGVELVIDYDQKHAALLARPHNRSAYRMIAKGLPDLDGYQRFTYKSEEWASYYGMRNLVEASNSRFKDANREDLGNRGKRSGRGFSSNYLVTALAISSFNLRSIATFILKLRDKAIEKPLRTRRRKDENERPLARLVTTRAAAPPG
jgi:hypothetical protein